MQIQFGEIINHIVSTDQVFGSKNILVLSYKTTEAYCIHLKKKNLLCFSELTS